MDERPGGSWASHVVRAADGGDGLGRRDAQTNLDILERQAGDVKARDEVAGIQDLERSAISTEGARQIGGDAIGSRLRKGLHDPATTVAHAALHDGGLCRTARLALPLCIRQGYLPDTGTQGAVPDVGVSQPEALGDLAGCESLRDQLGDDPIMTGTDVGGGHAAPANRRATRGARDRISAAGCATSEVRTEPMEPKMEKTMLQFLLARSMVQQTAVETLLALYIRERGPERAGPLFTALRGAAEDIGAKASLSDELADWVTEARLMTPSLTEAMIRQVETYWDGRPPR